MPADVTDDGSVGSVTIRYRLEPGESVAATRLWARIRVLRPMWWVLTPIFEVWLVVSLARADAALVAYLAGVFQVGIVMGILYLVVWGLFDLLARWEVHRTAAWARADDVRLVFDVEGVTMHTEPLTQRVDWRVSRGFLITERFIFIAFGHRGAYCIPTRVCGPEQFRAVIGVAPEWLAIRRRRRIVPHRVIRPGAPPPPWTDPASDG